MSNHQVIDRHDLIQAPKFFEDLGTDDDDILDDGSNFPDAVIMISLGGGRYGAMHVTTTGPDPMTVNVLVCFATEAEAEIWETANMSGEQVNKDFKEARDIAISKPNISGLALMVNAIPRSIHWVR